MTNLDKISHKLMDNNHRLKAKCGLMEREIERLRNENEQLKQELKIYRKIATCSNCKYQNYNWFEDGDEFEICEKGNNNQQIEYHICEEWEEFE